jgi:hypothetical protein
MKSKSGPGLVERIRERRAHRRSERLARLSKRRFTQHAPGRTGSHEWLGPGGPG